MGEPITIKKKKKLTIKSKAPAFAPDTSTDAPEVMPEAAAGPEVVLPGITPGVAPQVAGSSANYTVYTILAFIVLAMFIGILIVQWIEWSYLSPAFPRPLPVTGG